MDLRRLLDTSVPDLTGSRERETTSPLPSSSSARRSPSPPRAPSLFPNPPAHAQYYQPYTPYHSTLRKEGGPSQEADEQVSAGDRLRGPPPTPSAPALPSISSFFDLRNPPQAFYRPYGPDSRAGPSALPLGHPAPPHARPTYNVTRSTPSPDLTHSHSPASSSSTLAPHTPDLSYDSLPSPARRKRGSSSSTTPALDLLAVVAHISSTGNNSPGPSSIASGSGTSTPARLQQRSDEETITSSSASASSSGSRKRVRSDAGGQVTPASSTSTTSTTGAKKRKGRGLDPQKTRLMIFPPSLPPKTFAPDPSEGYSVRPQAAENLYAPTYTKGLDSRSRVAFCEYCGEGDLPTRMSGYGYHLLHTHNLSSHAPYIMPPPLRVRAAATSPPSSAESMIPPQPQPILVKEEVLGVPSPGLEGECPFGEGVEGQEKGARCCVLGGWHKLNSWRESMNSHLSGRGLDGGK